MSRPEDPASCAACGWKGAERDLIGEGDWIDVYCPACGFRVHDPAFDPALWRVQGRACPGFTVAKTPHLPHRTLLNIAELARTDALASKGPAAEALERLALAAEAAAAVR
jgi:hypothetical protein